MTSTPAGPSEHVEITLHSPLDLSEARRAARRFAGAHGGDDDSAYFLAMVVNEVATNGLEAHEREDITSPVTLSLAWVSELVRIEVRDLSAALPVQGGGVVNKEGGRGLTLVDECCSAWGWECGDGFKTVWADYKLPAAP